MASAYATLANRGAPPGAHPRHPDHPGRRHPALRAPRRRARRPCPTPVADQVTAVLRQVINRGTGTGARLDRPAAGKTGTAEGYRDAWFVGYTPQLTAAVWVGFADTQEPMVYPNTPIQVTGGSWPADIWRRFMAATLAGAPALEFPEPEGAGVRFDAPRSSSSGGAAGSGESASSTSTSTADPSGNSTGAEGRPGRRDVRREPTHLGRSRRPVGRSRAGLRRRRRLLRGWRLQWWWGRWGWHRRDRTRRWRGGDRRDPGRRDGRRWNRMTAPTAGGRRARATDRHRAGAAPRAPSLVAPPGRAVAGGGGRRVVPVLDLRLLRAGQAGPDRRIRRPGLRPGGRADLPGRHGPSRPVAAGHLGPDPGRAGRHGRGGQRHPRGHGR